MVNKGSRGFSLIELIVVVAVILILAALSYPQIQRVQTRYRLSASGHSVAGLLQQARLEAVRRNQPAYVQFDNTNPAPILVYENNDKSPYANGNPAVTTNGGVTLQIAIPGGLVDQLNAYLVTGPNVIVEPPGTPIGFNPRGLPCIGIIGNPAVCNQTDAANPNQIPAFLWVMTNNGADYEAVTVTVAGRTKAWRLARGATGCGFSKCWQ